MSHQKKEPLIHLVNQWQTIFDTISDAILILDINRQILWANKKAQQLFNLSSAEMKEKYYWEVVHGTQKPIPECPIERAGKNLYRESIELKIGDHYMLLHVDPVQDENQTLTGFILIFNDINDLRQISAALLESEIKFKHVFETANVGKSITSINGEIFVNKAFCDMLGYDIEELHNKTWQQLTPQEDIESIQNKLRLLLEGKQNSTRFIKRYIHKNGSFIWTDISIAVWRDANGKPIHYITTIIDISESKRTENALKESEEKLRLFIEHAPASLAMFDKDMRYLAVSRRWISEFHLQERNLIGKSHYDIFPEISDDLKAIHRRGMNGEMIKGDDAKFERADGSVQWLSWEMWPWKTADDSIGGIIIFSEDITERKRVEEILSNIQKLESLGVLAGGIAHDFNNLLGGIFQFIELTTGYLKDSKAINYLKSALGAITRARGLTDQLLTFAKGGDPVKKLCQLSPFIEETTRFALSGSHVFCSFTIQNDLWLCKFDKNRIGQVINNIVINAEQAMPEGGTIEISARNITFSEKAHITLPGGDYVVIAIKDHGIGMSKQMLSKIFDPFYTTKSRGHGLGLSTCYSIINRHGGCIEVESEPGRGSIFRIYLPATPDGVLIQDKIKIESHKGFGIFVVMDDEEVIRKAIGLILESFGYTVVLKENGKDVIEYFTKEKENITGMIFDLTIPGGMGGKEAINEIRKICSETPVFVSSGYADDPVVMNPKNYGFTASISKPFKIAELAEILNKYISKKNEDSVL